MSGPPPEGVGPVRPSRVERAERAARARRAVTRGVAAALTVIVVIIVGVAVLGGGADAPPPADPGTDTTKASTASRLVALQVNGGPAPMLAVVGVPAEGSPFLMPLSSELTVVVPGQGETSTAGIAALPGDSMRVALSNMSGIWIEHFAVLSLRDLAAAIDAAGGVAVNLPDTYPTTSGVLGPGEMRMTGSQAKAFLAGATDDLGVRWEILLDAMLADPPPLVTTESVETDDGEAVNATLTDARGAEVLDIPTERITSSIVVPVYPTLDELLSRALDSPMPVPAIVQNGSGKPGVGEAVAVQIIPAGFRVVLSQNAQSFDLGTTKVFAHGVDHEAEAEAVRKALGIGRVRVAAVPSNVGDITIVVGKDFTA